MAYTKHVWASNELVTADALNNIEDGISGKKDIQTAVTDPTSSGTAVSFIDSISQNTQGVISATKKTVAEATTSASGLMSSTDKSKLNGIASGAQVNSITGVKGDAENSYRIGNVNLTPANIGALPANTTFVSGIKGNEESSYRSGDVNLTLANIGAAAASTHQWNFYSNPTQLGLTGNSSVLQIFNALPDDSVIITSGNLLESDLPNGNSTGELMIWRVAFSRTFIMFFGKGPYTGTWRMYLGASSYNGNDANAPNGTWYRVYDGLDGLRLELPAATDANTIEAGVFVVMRCDTNTTHTPYSDGLAPNTDSFIVSARLNTTYGTQFWFGNSGTKLFVRRMASGTWGAWTCIAEPENRFTRNSQVNVSAATIGTRVFYDQVDLPSGVTGDNIKSVFISKMTGAPSCIVVPTIAPSGNNFKLVTNVYAAATGTITADITVTVIY